MNKHVFFLTVMICLFIIFSGSVYGEQIKVVSVDSMSVGTLTTNMNAGEKITGSLSISGGSGNDIDFWVTNPIGETVLNQGRVSQGSEFEFTATRDGAYTLHFDNSFSIFSGKIVNLTYDVTLPAVDLPFVGGIDPIVLLGVLLVIVIIIIVILVIRRNYQRAKSD